MRFATFAAACAAASLVTGSLALAEPQAAPADKGDGDHPAHVRSDGDNSARTEGSHGHPHAFVFRMGEMQAKPVTWMGVAASPATPVIEHQLRLQPGVGLIVDQVMPDSPAAKAGLQEYDVLHKLDDQLLVNVEQLATLVRLHKSGDTVTLTVMRDGKPTDLKVTLGEHNEPGVMPFIHPPMLGGEMQRGGWGRIGMHPGMRRDGEGPGNRPETRESHHGQTHRDAKDKDDDDDDDAK